MSYKRESRLGFKDNTASKSWGEDQWASNIAGNLKKPEEVPKKVIRGMTWEWQTTRREKALHLEDELVRSAEPGKEEQEVEEPENPCWKKAGIRGI